MLRSASQIFLTICGAALLAGCGGANTYDSSVTGTVTIDGELANSGTVIFYPVKKGGLVATSRIFPDGSYSLRTGQGDLTDVDGGTVQSGDYLVTVSIVGPPAPGAVVAEGGPPVSGPSLIAEKYSLKDTTDLKFSVEPGPNVFVLELEAAKPAVAEEHEATSESEGNSTDESFDGSETAAGTSNGIPGETNSVPVPKEAEAK